MTSKLAPAGNVIWATVQRELLSHRLNRFLHLHVALVLVIGCLALLLPPEAASAGAAWWLLNGVLYVASLSALLLGLSSAQAEADEFAILFTQPLRFSHWVLGKCAGLFLIIVPSSFLLIAPTALVAGLSPLLIGAVSTAALVTMLMAMIGLAVGLWIVDPVRGLITAVATWCVLLFGVDLLLLSIGGADWVQQNAWAWVAPLMASPLDAYRVTLLFVLEKAAFTGSDLDPLTRWWLDHASQWFVIVTTFWILGLGALAIFGARRRATG